MGIRLVVLLLLILPHASAEADSSVPAYSLGETGPGGGIVFITPQFIHDRFISRGTTPSEADQYYEIATEDLPTRVPWCDVSNEQLIQMYRELSDKTHSQRRITEIIAGKCKESAANMALNYRGGGREDWFLPSTSTLAMFVYSGLAKTIPEERLWWTNSFIYASAPNTTTASGILYQPNLSGEGYYAVQTSFQNLNLVRPVRLITPEEVASKLKEVLPLVKTEAETESDNVATAVARERARSEALAKASSNLGGFTKKSVTCVKGKTKKVFSGKSPKCPKGFKRVS